METYPGEALVSARGRLREIATPPLTLRNRIWENWGPLAFLLSSLIFFLGFAISILEVVRITYGVTNRGISNYNFSNDVNNGNNVPVKDDSLLWPVGVGNAFPARTEKFHYWPWSYGANLFGLIAMITGIIGIISTYRRSYASIFLFMTFALLTSAFFAFMIGYYSVLVNYYVRLNYLAAGHAQTINTSFGIIVTNLILSIILCLLALFAAIWAAMALRICCSNNKGVLYPAAKVHHYPPNPSSELLATTYLK